MRIVMLTRFMPHHTYFMELLVSSGIEIVQVICEPKLTDDSHLEEQRYDHERMLYPGGEYPYAKTSPALEVTSVNMPGVAEHLQALRPDLGIVFGTGKVSPEIFNIPTHGMINVHRGIAQAHRGLDSNYWAMHAGNWDDIGVTIHHVDKDFDTGAILSQQRLKITPEFQLWHERQITTAIAARLVIRLFKREDTPAWLTGKGAPRGRGEYRSAMTLGQKQETHDRLDTYKATL